MEIYDVSEGCRAEFTVDGDFSVEVKKGVARVMPDTPCFIHSGTTPIAEVTPQEKVWQIANTMLKVWDEDQGLNVPYWIEQIRKAKNGEDL